MTLMLCMTSLPMTALAEEQGTSNGTSTVETVDGESTPEETGAEGETEAEGETKETGAEGETKKTGAEGETKETGAEGETKEAGAEGETEAGGETGETGTEGETGSKGESGETDTKDKSGETGAESATDEAVSPVQQQIDSLPEVDALSTMKEDERNTAYMAIQEAYAAYDALTAEQQAQITGADCFEELFGWFNGQVAPLATGNGKIEYGIVDEKTGETEPWEVERNDYYIVDESMTVWTVPYDAYYVLKEKSTVELSSLTIQGGSLACLYLGKDTTLTINGSLTFKDGSKLFVYGPSDGIGKVIINNAPGSAAIKNDNESMNSYLAVQGGELEITSTSGLITDGVSLRNGGEFKRYMEYKIDGQPMTYDENKELLSEETIKGKSLTLTWCEHDNATYASANETQHTMHCAQCGFVGDPVACTFDDNGGYDPGDANGHYAKCICGNKNSSPSEHYLNIYPTDDGKHHIESCQSCGYVKNGAEQGDHVWDNERGECTVCRFEPVATDNKDNLYGYMEDVLKAVAEGKAEYAMLYSPKTDKEITPSVDFEYPDATVTLKMNGYTLDSLSGPALDVSDGTLKITGDATIKSGGQFQDTASSAISVSGGKLIFENDLTAEGSLYDGTRRPAVTASDGELEFNGGLNLNGGLTLTGNATLTKKLTQGTFYAEGDTGSARVSVAGSKVYQHVYDLLAEGYAFAEKDDTNNFVDANVTTLTQDVTIVQHVHNYQPVTGSDDYKCVDCGKTCSHEGGYHDGGRCSVCDKPCPHANVTEGIYVCNDCGDKMLMMIETGSQTAYGTDLAAAMNEAENGTKITLLSTVGLNESAYILGKEGSTSAADHVVTLDLNGNTVSGQYTFTIGKYSDSSGNNRTAPGKLIITGEGNLYVNIYVGAAGELDLSAWTEGTIQHVGLIASGSKFTSTEGRGTINNLWVIPGQKYSLTGGSYGNITKDGDGELKLGDLLAEGYAFQTSDGFVEYTLPISYSYSRGCKVVKCPHEKIEDGTCVYCGKSNIVAMVDGTVYSDITEAINAWTGSGRKLTLHADCGISGATWSADGERTLDLNGYALTGGKPDLAYTMDLTIQDASVSGSGKIDNLTVNDGAKLTLEGGGIGNLNVKGAADGNVKLRDGWFTAGEINVPAYRMLEEGYCLMNGNITVDPEKKLSTGTEYRAKKVAIEAIGEKSGEIVIGENRVPIEVSLSVDKSKESDIARVQFRWYVVKEDGTVQQLAAGKEVQLSEDGSVSYKSDATDSKDFAEAWGDLEVEKTYNLICTVRGMESGGAYQWETVLKGYQMTITKADLNSEKTVITQTAGTGNTMEGGERLVVQPNAEQGFDDVTSKFDVTYNGKPLTLDKDYTIQEDSNTAKDAGEHVLTIVGKGNYTGEKTVTWRIEPYKLSGKHVSVEISKKYDGTNTAGDNTVGVERLGIFTIDSTNKGNPTVDSSCTQLDLRNSVTKTNLHFDAAEAGARTLFFTLTLTTDNFVFENGKSTAEFELSQKETSDLPVSISKRDGSEPEAKKVYVVNGHAATYTVDLAEMLPKLDGSMKYGDVQYKIHSYVLEPDYITGNTASIKDGKLELPILASQRTGNVNVGTIKVAVSSTNIDGFYLQIEIEAKDRIVPTGTPDFSKTELTYGDLLSTITISGTMTDPTTNEAVKGTFAWDTPDQKMDAAGTYEATWKFVPEDTAVYATATGTVTIKVNKATLTGAPTYKTITAGGKKLSDAALAANDKWPAGTLEWVDDKGNALQDDTEVKANTTYKWLFTPENTNYDILTGEVELWHVEAPAISAQPKNVSVITGEKAAFEVTATGTDVTYQWQIDRNDGKGFVDITGADSASYTTGVTDKDCDGFKYQCVISNAAGSVTTDTAVLTVKEKYTITATAGKHGSISPSGAVEVVEGSNQTFAITAEEGYEIKSLTVDGKSVDAVTSYTFENVAAAHTIGVTFKLQYKILDGANSSWTQNTDGSIRIRGNGEFSKFVNVKVDGVIVDPANYTVTEGSTIIEFKPEYLKTLSEGSHTFEMIWTDGSASTSFTVAKNTSGGDDSGNNDSDDNNPGSDDSGNNDPGDNNDNSKPKYEITDGANSSWTQNTDGSGSIKIRGNGEFSKFVNVKVDGVVVDPVNYKVTEGSTIIEFKPEYLKTLSEGTHTFEIAWTDGTASTSFTVAKNTSGSDDPGNNDSDDNDDNSNNDNSNNNSNNNNNNSNTAQTLTKSPKTGDASGLWIALFAVSAAGLAVMLVVRRKKQ